MPPSPLPPISAPFSRSPSSYAFFPRQQEQQQQEQQQQQQQQQQGLSRHSSSGGGGGGPNISQLSTRTTNSEIAAAGVLAGLRAEGRGEVTAGTAVEGGRGTAGGGDGVGASEGGEGSEEGRWRRR